MRSIFRGFDQPLDPVDDVVDGEVRRVDRLRVRRRAHLGRVALVAQAQVGGKRLGADLGPLFAAPASTLPRVGDEVDLHLGVGTDDGADVTPFDDGVAHLGELALALSHHLPHLGMARHRRDDAVDARGADLLRDLGAGDEHRAALEGDGVRARERAEGGRVLERRPALEREPGDGPVHGARVQGAKAESLGEPPSDRGLACPGRAVDRDDHRPFPFPGKARPGEDPVRAATISPGRASQRTLRSSKVSKKPGKLTATLSAPSISTGSREVSAAIAPNMAMRWSPRLSTTPPPLGRVGTPITKKPSSRASMRTPTALSALVTLSIRSDSFTRSSRAPRTTLLPWACAAASAKSGSSSTRS